MSYYICMMSGVAIATAAKIRSESILKEIELMQYLPQTGKTYYVILFVAGSRNIFDGCCRMVYYNEHFSLVFRNYIKYWIRCGNYESGWTGYDMKPVMACVQDFHPKIIDCNLIKSGKIPIFYLRINKGKLKGLGCPGPFTFLIREDERAERMLSKLDDIVDYVYLHFRNKKGIANELNKNKWYQWVFKSKRELREYLINKMASTEYLDIYKFIVA